MQTRKIALVCALVGVVAFSSYALGQQNAVPDDVSAFEKDLDDAYVSLKTEQWADTRSGATKITALSNRAVGNQTLTESIVSQAIARRYSDGDPKAEIRLQALQVAQNQRIIELLEQLNAKK